VSFLDEKGPSQVMTSGGTVTRDSGMTQTRCDIAGCGFSGIYTIYPPFFAYSTPFGMWYIFSNFILLFKCVCNSHIPINDCYCCYVRMVVASDVVYSLF